MNRMQKRARRRKAFAAKRVAKAMMGNGALSWEDMCDEVRAFLWDTMQQGLIVPTGATVRLIHDEILIDLPVKYVTVKGTVDV